MRFLRVLLYFALSCVHTITAQTTELAQVYSSPLALNPSLAGSEGCSRIAFDFRNLIPGHPEVFRSINVSYDQYIRSLRGGIGYYSWYDFHAENGMSMLYSGLVYSLKLKLRDFQIAPSVEVGYGTRSINWKKIGYPDTTDPRYDSITSSRSNKEFFSFSSGFLINSKQHYIGVAVDNINRPDIGYGDSEFRLPVQITIHGGTRFSLGVSDSGMTFSPNVIYKREEDFQNFSLGGFASKGKITGGMWYKAAGNASHGIVVVMGFRYRMVNLSYSYDISFSKLVNSSGGTHELSIRLLFNCKNKEEKIIPLNTIAF